MKVICNQKLLANKISIVQKAISNKTTLELLKGILLTTANDTLQLTGYDLEMGIETSTAAEIIESGQIVINSKLFGDIIRKLPDTFVEIESDADNNIYINCANSKFKLKGYSTSDYPKLPDVKKSNLYQIPQDLLKNMIKQTVFAISQDQTKPVLMGELLEITDNKVNLVAIDGYRLAVKSSQVQNTNDYTKVIIPGKTLHDINGLLSHDNNNIEIGFDEKNAVVIVNDIKITTRLLEGEFIDYQKLIPREYNLKVKVNTKDLLESIERASLLSLPEKNNLIKLSIRDNLMSITSNTDKGNVYEEVEIKLDGEYLDIAFNSRYLIDALKVIESEEIYIEFTTNVNPGIIKPVDDPMYTYLLLPVRISNNA